MLLSLASHKRQSCFLFQEELQTNSREDGVYSRCQILVPLIEMSPAPLKLPQVVAALLAGFPDTTVIKEAQSETEHVLFIFIIGQHSNSEQLPSFSRLVIVGRYIIIHVPGTRL